MGVERTDAEADCKAIILIPELLEFIVAVPPQGTHLYFRPDPVYQTIRFGIRAPHDVESFARQIPRHEFFSDGPLLFRWSP